MVIIQNIVPNEPSFNRLVVGGFANEPIDGQFSYASPDNSWKMSRGDNDSYIYSYMGKSVIHSVHLLRDEYHVLYITMRVVLKNIPQDLLEILKLTIQNF